ncbi:MAG: hypothetical protein K9K66_09230 [Desulfarculaceae bacterium]|nr:hypothetical protein [Desulfarculaceae bacterium]MCF8073086.1 hypothetical protein [Desulfarculaceae bacterium]MCF8101829.1 hypothetical protein [Desulfarculaceae bacterium]MCF8115356.1 hypothetical protein [Desulfarculaceae bacterium]
MPDRLADWLLWFGLLPAGGLLIFGGLTYLWARTVTLTRRRAWVVTLALGALFTIVEIVMIYKLSYLVFR